MTSIPRSAAARESSRASAVAAGPAIATVTGSLTARSSADRVAARAAPQRAGHIRRLGGEQVGKLGVEVLGKIDGAAAGQRPQRGCGRQLGGGADVDEVQAHIVWGGAAGLDSPAAPPPRSLERGRLPMKRQLALGCGDAGAVSLAGSKPVAYLMFASLVTLSSHFCQEVCLLCASSICLICVLDWS